MLFLVVFYKENKTFTILKGNVGTYSYKEIKKCSIAGEHAAFKGKRKPFTQTVLITTVFNSVFADKKFYLGLMVLMKDNTKLHIYMSEKACVKNTERYFKDLKQAKEISKIMNQCIKKYKNE